MLKLVPAALLLALAAPALAQEPTEQQKHDALLKAYHMNGDSMVGWGSIDLSQPPPVKTERAIPEAKAEQFNEIDVAAAQEARRRSVHRALREVRRRLVDSDDDVCTRHHTHKVLTDGGKSWHCKK